MGNHTCILSLACTIMGGMQLMGSTRHDIYAGRKAPLWIDNGASNGLCNPHGRHCHIHHAGPCALSG